MLSHVGPILFALCSPLIKKMGEKKNFAYFVLHLGVRFFLASNLTPLDIRLQFKNASLFVCDVIIAPPEANVPKNVLPPTPPKIAAGAVFLYLPTLELYSHF